MNAPPLVSLLIPMRNEASYIRQCLGSIINQTYTNIEVLIFDGLSGDGSYEIVEKLIKDQEKIHLFSNPKKIQAVAWNQGIIRAKGDILSIVSAHSELAPDYVEQVVETLLRTNADLIGGPTNAISDGVMAETIAIALNTPFGIGDARFHYATSEIEVDTVFMGSCWRRVYEWIGGFDEEMVRNQDDELSYRLRKHGGTIICNPMIRSKYFSRQNLHSLWNQYFQYGFWKVRVLQKHPRQMRLRQFVPPAFVGSLLAALVLASIGSPGRWLLAGIAAAYLAANLTASLHYAARAGWRHLLLLPLVFIVLHVSYGLGFWIGLVRFAGRWGDKSGKVPEF